MVCNGCAYGEEIVSRGSRFFLYIVPLLLLLPLLPASLAQNAPPAGAFEVLENTKAGPRITPFLQYQLDQAWRQDESQQKVWESIQSEADLLKLQQQMRQSILEMIGGFP